MKIKWTRIAPGTYWGDDVGHYRIQREGKLWWAYPTPTTSLLEGALTLAKAQQMCQDEEDMDAEDAEVQP